MTASDPLFSYIESMQGSLPWGRVLDTGTGWHSMHWLQSIRAESWTAVTIDPTRMTTMMPKIRPTMRPKDRLLLGNWEDPTFLAKEQFDVVLMDYLVGAIDAFTPYLQDRIFQRLRPHIGQRLYLIGLEPLPNGHDDPAIQAMIDLDRLKDACRLLAGRRPYREFPASWIARRCVEADLSVMNIQHFDRILRESFVHSRIAACRRLLPEIPCSALREGLSYRIDELEKQLLVFASRPEGIQVSSNYVLTARPQT